MNHYALLVGDGNSAANGEKESFWFFETDAESIADALNKLEKRIRRIAIPDTYDPEEWDSYASYIFNRDDIDLGGAWLLAYNENGEVQELFPMHVLNDPDEKSFSYFTHVADSRTSDVAYSTKSVRVTTDLIRQYFPDFPLSDSDPDQSVRKNNLENGTIKGFEPIDYTARERKNPDWGSGAAVHQTGAERIARYMMRLKSPNFNPLENEDDSSTLVQLIQLKNTHRIEGFTAEDLKLIDDMIVKWNFNRAPARFYRIKRALDNIYNDTFIPTDPQDLKDMRYLLDLKAADALAPFEVKKLDAVCKRYDISEAVDPSKKWTREEIQHLIDTREEMCYRSLMMLYERQTEDEKADNDVKHNNGMGFRFMDAEFLTSLAESYKKYHRLTPKQLEVLRKKLQHYVGQLTKIANGKL